mmetsp:Transcript_1578/g.4956  ORF Transcript_1578/g.4956 Transcript_1578/m.4956 type:complete len:214 (+) Transcript_1578:848-1489(+)
MCGVFVERLRTNHVRVRKVYPLGVPEEEHSAPLSRVHVGQYDVVAREAGHRGRMLRACELGLHKPRAAPPAIPSKGWPVALALVRRARTHRVLLVGEIHHDRRAHLPDHAPKVRKGGSLGAHGGDKPVPRVQAVNGTRIDVLHCLQAEHAVSVRTHGTAKSVELRVHLLLDGPALPQAVILLHDTRAAPAAQLGVDGLGEGLRVGCGHIAHAA